GHHLQLVLTQQPETAHDILADLSANKKGRASVAPLAFSSNGAGPGQSVSGGESGRPGPVLNGVPLPAAEGIQSEASVTPLLNRLLGGTRIVRDLNAATTEWRAHNGAFSYVTLAGELLSSHGVYTGGYANSHTNGKGAASILGRKNQITDLSIALAELTDQL